MAYSGQGTVPPASAPGTSGVLPGQQAVNTTRVLALTGFSKDLKTRDIQSIFVDFEDDRGGYRIKWLDDTGCLIVFNDPLTAKKAFLHLLANPHPHLLPFKNAEGVSAVPKLGPYADEDAPQVIASVANRPRSRSIATGSNPSGISTSSPASSHGRRLSTSSGTRMTSSTSASNINGQAIGGNGNGSTAGSVPGPLSRSFGRQSMSQYQLQAIADEAANAEESGSITGGPNGTASPPSPTSTTGGAIDWNAYQQEQQRNRAGSGSFSPPSASPERGMQGSGANSPTRLRRLTNAPRA